LVKFSGLKRPQKLRAGLICFDFKHRNVAKTLILQAI